MARLLVVESEPDARRLLVHWIQGMGHSCRSHGTPAAALDAMSRERFDALLVDVLLPVIDGPELIRVLRARGLSGAPIAMSTVTEPEDHPPDVPVDGWLAKPFARADVERVVSELLAVAERRPAWR